MLTSILPEDYTRVKDAPCVKNSKFKTVYTLDSVFKEEDPPESDLILFVKSRSGLNYEDLDSEERSDWLLSWRMNRILAGYIVYSTVYPSILKRRIKLRDASDHWVEIDPTVSKGSSKKKDRERCLGQIRELSASLVFKGVSRFVPKDVLIMDFMDIPCTDDDEGVVFFTEREFPSSTVSSAHGSCSSILSHLWFVTTVLGRPCSLDSIVMPIQTGEISRLRTENLFFKKGKISKFPVNWSGEVFSKLPGYVHSHYSGVFIEKFTSDSYMDKYPCDLFLEYKSVINGPVSVPASTYCTVHNTVTIPCFDHFIFKNEACSLDALDMSSISMEFGKDTARGISLTKPVGVFSASLQRKMVDTLKYFSEEHMLVRKLKKKRLCVIQSMDPGGIKKKLSQGKMLDPRVPKNVKMVKDIIRSIAGKTWIPLKNLLFKLYPDIGPELEEGVICERFLEYEECEEVYNEATSLGLEKSDVSNLCLLFSLTMSFQRSQLVRDSRKDEYVRSRSSVGYTLSLGREIKTSGASCGGHVASTEFDLSISQSMIVHFIKLFGKGNEFLMVNERGSHMSQENLTSRYKSIGRAWLGIPNMTPHVMRSFWTTHAVEEGLVNSHNINEFASYLQLSSKTLMTSYVAASTQNDSHRVGKRVLGPVMNSASTKRVKQSKNVYDVESRPKGKKLACIRNEYIREINASLSRYKDPVHGFNALVEQRAAGCLGEKDSWFEWDTSYFADEDVRLFVRFVQNRKKIY